MARVSFKPGNMLYPLPVVMVSVADKAGNSNIFTVAWTGTICSNPPMVSISVRPERYSYHMIQETGEFVINLTTKELTYATDYCGVQSGKTVDKWERLHLTRIPGREVQVPLIAESPVNIECKVTEVKKLGTHDMFLAEVVAVQVDDVYMDEKQRFHLTKAEPIVYSHGEYYLLGEKLGKFGYSIQKDFKKKHKEAPGQKRNKKADRKQEKVENSGKTDNILHKKKRKSDRT